MKSSVLFFLLSFVSLIALGQDTVSFYFDFDEFTIPQNKVEQNTIPAQSTPLEIRGYTDYFGTNAYNKQLASDRIAFIKNALALDAAVNEFVVGESTAYKETWRNRRVDVIYAKQKEGIEAVEIQDASEMPIEEEIISEIKTLKKGETLVIKNMEFQPGRHVLTEYSFPELKKLLNTLKANPNLKIEIQGHICCQEKGDGVDWDTGKEELSINRAKAVYDYLIIEGIPKKQLSYKGYGASRKLYPETNQENMQRNRRVEILILEN